MQRIVVFLTADSHHSIARNQAARKYKPAGSTLLQAVHSAKYFRIVLAFQHLSRLKWRFGRDCASRQHWSGVEFQCDCISCARADDCAATAARVDRSPARGKEASRTFNRTAQTRQQAFTGCNRK